MEQLSAFDNVLMRYETEATPAHIGCMAIYDTTTAEVQPVRFKHILATFQSRLHKAAVLRKRLVTVPGNIDYPYWIADPAFDIEFHIRHIALPEPGDWRQLCIQLSRLYARPLNMSRPPWEVYIIEGLNKTEVLPDGCFAMVVKVHTGLIQDNVVNVLLSVMHDLKPTSVQPSFKEPWVADRFPSLVELLARASINSVQTTIRRARILSRYSVPTLKLSFTSLLNKGKNLIRKMPKTRFNTQIQSSHRVFEAVTLAYKDIEKVASTLHGLTALDVILAIISDGLRHYLKEKNELPEQSLSALVPILEHKTKLSHNSHFLLPKLYTNIENPLEKLHAIHSALVRAKNGHNRIEYAMLADCAELLPTTITRLLFQCCNYYQFSTKIGRQVCNVIVDYAKGPQIPLYLNDTKLLQLHTIGSLFDGVGLFHSVFHYNQSITISILSHRDMLPDPANYAQHIIQAAKKLYDAVEDKIEKKPKQSIKIVGQ